MTTPNKIQISLLIWIIFFWIAMAIKPLFRDDWMMENILFIISFATLIFTYKKFTFSNRSYILITIFLTLHLIGAHYTYSKVPLGNLAMDYFNFTRNHFDRVAHLAFGLLIAYPLHELLLRKTNPGKFLSYFLPINIILAWGAFFEIVEWLFAANAYPELAQGYLGLQGDFWDAQQDMLIALIGAMLAMFTTFLIKKFKS